MIHIERDPNNRRLELEVNDKILEIYKTIEPEKSKITTSYNSVNFVGVEDAIKELISMGEKI